jgi:hypothetical protein
MKFIWVDSPTHHRCTTDTPVKVKSRVWGGGSYKDQFVHDMGYVLVRDGRLTACVYGSINPECTGQLFNNIDDAKRYVEEQATVGLALNKLTR